MPANTARTTRGYAGSDRFGCPGYRLDAVKMLIHVADYSQMYDKKAQWTTDKVSSVAQVIKDNQIRYASVAQRYCGCNNGMKQLACYAGACNKDGQCYDNCENLSDCSSSSKTDLTAMYFAPSNGAEIWGFIKGMSANKELTIVPRVVDVTSGASKLAAGMTVVTSGSSVSGDTCTTVGNVDSSTGYQKLTGVVPATKICYSLKAKDGQTDIPATAEPQLLEARVQVTAEGSVLNSDRVYFVIPPAL